MPCVILKEASADCMGSSEAGISRRVFLTCVSKSFGAGCPRRKYFGQVAFLNQNNPDRTLTAESKLPATLLAAGKMSHSFLNGDLSRVS